KAQISSEEARLQAAKALEIETQLERCKYEMNRNEEEKQLYARQINGCKQIISTLVNDSVQNSNHFYSSHCNEFNLLSSTIEQRRQEADELKLELAKWRVAEAAAREKLLAITQVNQSLAVSNSTTAVQSSSSRPINLSPPPYQPITRIDDSNQINERIQLIEKQS
ncbi:unnamed protein product, partial [Adineta steineri]